MCETEMISRPPNGTNVIAKKNGTANEVVNASSADTGRLLWWDECPPKLQFNRYIASGYRSNISYKQCACSLFSVHNETSNVWLHFAPALCVIVTMVEWFRIKEHPHRGAFFSVLVPQLCCLLLSTAYHLFMAQVKHYDFWLKFDICGVFGVMVVPYWASAWWGYRCQPTSRVVVLALYYGCAALSLVASVVGKTTFARAFPMGMLWLTRLASLAHRWWLGTCSPVALSHYAWMEVICFTGATINILRIPERWMHKLQPTEKRIRKAQPLDLFGNSHNIMHVLSVAAMYYVYQGVLRESEFVLLSSCPQ